MESSTTKQITTLGNQTFFLSPQFPLQRQYEALRAYLVDEEPSADVARRFGYSPGFFRVLCYQFRHDPQKRAAFFRLPQRGPQSSPARDRVRDLAVAMRKRNLSVYPRGSPQNRPVGVTSKPASSWTIIQDKN
jgi:hypothetical protein